MSTVTTNYVNTFSGLVYVLSCVPERGHIIQALHAHDADLFPLLHTHVNHIEGANWFAHTVDSNPLVEHRHTRASPTFSSMEFFLPPDCFEDSKIDAPTEFQLKHTDAGLPYSLTIFRYPGEDGTMEYNVDHTFRGFCMGCTDGVHSGTDLVQRLTECRHAVHADGSCSQLKKEAILDILRLYDVYRAMPHTA